MSGTLSSGSGQFLPSPLLYTAEAMRASVSDGHARTGKGPRLLVAVGRPVLASLALSQGTSLRFLEKFRDKAGVTQAGYDAARFELVVAKTEPISAKRANSADNAGSVKSKRLVAKVAAPAPERFAPLPGGSPTQNQTLLAFADPSPTAVDAWSAVLAGPAPEDAAAAQDSNLDPADAAQSGDEDFPSVVPLPQLRPLGDPAPKAADKEDVPQVDEPPVEERAAPKQQKLAYARPDEPAEKKSGGGLGGALRNLFCGGSKAGNGVAVYDISAAKVYMPDGSVLEAHSGIGKMADNPRYVDVKMHGPTPPHTYDLTMRETRFHGVEALRMTPIDGKNRNGRGGILAHSYLLRGGRAESHGCVAFKDYGRFLKAFKQGKIKQLVVVPSGGRANTRLASNDKNI